MSSTVSDDSMLAEVQAMAKHLGLPVPKTMAEAEGQTDSMKRALLRAVDEHNAKMEAEHRAPAAASSSHK